MARLYRVALLIESWDGFGRRLLQGVAAYAGTYGPWTFHHGHRAFDDPVPADLVRWKPDGIIARIGTPEILRQLRSFKVPIVDLHTQYRLPGASRVSINDASVVRLGLEHLTGCGFRNVAFVGMPGHAFSEERRRAFLAQAAKRGLAAHVLPPDRRGASLTLAEWLRQLPKPIGIMACNDNVAQGLMTICGEEGIAIPEDVALIGSDNDEVSCDLCCPTLTSVDSNGIRIGHEAAGLLHRLMEGRVKRPQNILIEPAGVVRRRSTDVLAVDDPLVVKALRHIQEHVGTGLTVDDLLRHSDVSRATLDRAFRKTLRRSPSSEIARIRIRRVEELLATTDLPLKQIARLTGFTHAETMYRVFKKATGMTPAQHRRKAGAQNSHKI